MRSLPLTPLPHTWQYLHSPKYLANFRHRTWDSFFERGWSKFAGSNLFEDPQYQIYRKRIRFYDSSLYMHNQGKHETTMILWYKLSLTRRSPPLTPLLHTWQYLLGNTVSTFPKYLEIFLHHRTTRYSLLERRHGNFESSIFFGDPQYPIHHWGLHAIHP